MPEKETDLPEMTGDGVAPKKLKSMDDALEAMLSAREKRMSYGEKEGEAQANLVKLFKKNNLTAYFYDGKKFVLVDIEKVKVERKPKEDED